jgi:branched-chain amino acid transport system substrate-binding protein
MYGKSLKRVVLLLVAALILASCAPAATPTPKSVEPTKAPPTAVPATAVPAAKPIKIGHVVNMTGPDAYVGMNQTYGAMLAAEEINAAGGVLGRPVELVALDDGNDPKQAVIVANTFIDDPDIMAVYIGSNSGNTIPVVPVLCDAKMPYVQIGSNPRITELGCGYGVQNSPNDEIAGRAFGDVLKEIGVKTVAILHNKSMYAEYVSEQVQERCQELGITVTSFQGVDYTQTTDFTPVLTKIKGENPEALMYGGYSEAGLVRKQMVELGMKDVKFVTLERSKELRDTVGDAGIGMYSVAQSPTLDYNQGLRDWTARFQARFNQAPETWTVFDYDGVKMIADAITRAGGTEDKAALAKAITESQYTGVGGEYQFDTSGRMLKPFVFVTQMNENRDFVPVKVYFGVYKNPLPAAKP